MTEPKTMPLAHATASGEQPTYSLAIPENPNANEPTAPSGSMSQSVGKWVHQNKWFTKEPVTFIGYQMLRSAAAAVPYGFGMAAVHHGMGALAVQSQKMGYTAAEFAKAKELGGFGELAKQVGTFAKTDTKSLIARNVARVATSPLNAALQIGLAFTMFRTVGDVVKGVRDKITDPHNTEAETIHEVHNAGNTAQATLAKSFPAQAVSVPFAALTLGFMNGNFKPQTEYKKLKGENFGQTMKRVWGPKSGLLQNMALWTLSYSAFFEIADRLAKDFQIRKGTWTGYPNSTNKTPDDITGQPPDYSHVTVHGREVTLQHHGHKHGHKHHQHAEHSPWFSSMTEDPSLGRILFRRIIPVALGIGSYTIAKRAGYVLGGGQMTPITEGLLNKGVAENTKTFLGNAWREGMATSTFFVVWTFTDAMASTFDKIFGEHAKADPIIQKNHQELLAKLNAKEHSLARAG
jgi:hypothetical protein